MSTYLVAFVICDYDSISNKTLKQIDVAIHTPPGLLSQAQFALQTAVQLMDYYDDFFGVAYPLPKQGSIFCHTPRRLPRTSSVINCLK